MCGLAAQDIGNLLADCRYGNYAAVDRLQVIRSGVVDSTSVYGDVRCSLQRGTAVYADHHAGADFGAVGNFAALGIDHLQCVLSGVAALESYLAEKCSCCCSCRNVPYISSVSV